MEQEDKDLQVPQLSENTDAQKVPQENPAARPVPTRARERELEAAPGVPQPENQLPSLALMQRRGQSPAAAKPTHKRSKKALLLLALVFLLFMTILILPVSRLPGMGYVFERMGMSVSDVQSMSLGKFLWTWAGGGGGFSRMSAGTGAGAMHAIFDRNQMGEFNADGPRSGLYDLAAVNADRRARGLGADSLYGAYYGEVSEEERAAALNRQPNGWSAEAQAATEQKNSGEVFFGTDSEIYARAGEGIESRGSTDTLKLLPRASIMGAVPPDWLNAAIGKAARLSEGDMTRAVEKASQVSVGLSRLNGQLTAGKPSQRDLARVWLLSNAANKAHQPMLKKQLASAGYMAMEIPSKVYDSFGDSSGLMMRGDEVLTNFADTNKKMLDDEQCQKLAAQANGNIDALLNEARGTINTIISTQPKSCDAASINSWAQQLQAVSGTCQKVQQQFKGVGSVCAIQQANGGSCSTPVLTTYVSDLSGACSELASLLGILNTAEGILKAAIAALDQAREDEKRALKDYQDAEKAYQDALSMTPPPENLESLKNERDRTNQVWKDSVKAREKAEDDKNKAQNARNDAKYNYDSQQIVIYGNKGAKGVENIAGKPPHGQDNGIVNNTGKDDITASFNIDEGLNQAGTNPFFPEVGEDQSKQFIEQQTEFDRN